MLSYHDALENQIVHLSANACLTPLCALDGYNVTTVEGIGSVRDGLHPVQERLSSLHGSQCGYCTPGIIMALYTQLKKYPNSTPHDIEDAMDGNLCRCTGYRPIIDAAKSLSNVKGSCGNSCSNCPSAKNGDCNHVDDDFVFGSTEHTMHTHSSLEEISNNGTEKSFPTELINYTPRNIEIVSGKYIWFQPTDMIQLLQYKEKHPTARFVVGNTEVGIEVKFKKFEYHYLINPVRVAELKMYEVEASGIRVGAATTINNFRHKITSLSQSNKFPSYALRGLLALEQMLSWFASNHIRNVACLGGNIVTASPISDLNPMLMSLGAILRMRSLHNGIRDVPMKDFFLGYRKVDLAPGEVLENIWIPFTTQWEYVMPFKQARRREDDISIVTAGVRVKIISTKSPSSPAAPDDTEKWLVEDFDVSFGGMAPTTIRAPKTASVIIGNEWSTDTLDQALEAMRAELALPENVPGGQAEYRLALATSCLFRAYFSITKELNRDIASVSTKFPPLPTVSSRDESAIDSYLTQSKPPTRGQQSYASRKGSFTASPLLSLSSSKDENATTVEEPVGKSLVHKSAPLQVSVLMDFYSLNEHDKVLILYTFI